MDLGLDSGLFFVESEGWKDGPGQRISKNLLANQDAQLNRQVFMDRE